MSVCESVNLWVPPENFSLVEPGIFRSGFPKKKNFAFLKKLKIRSIVCLVQEEYPSANLQFLHSIGAKLMQFGVAGNKVLHTPIYTHIHTHTLPDR